MKYLIIQIVMIFLFNISDAQIHSICIKGIGSNTEDSLNPMYYKYFQKDTFSIYLQYDISKMFRRQDTNIYYFRDSPTNYGIIKGKNITQQNSAFYIDYVDIKIINDAFINGKKVDKFNIKFVLLKTVVGGTKMEYTTIEIRNKETDTSSTHFNNKNLPVYYNVDLKSKNLLCRMSFGSLTSFWTLNIDMDSIILHQFECSDLITSIAPPNSLQSLQVFPNPSKIGLFYIEGDVTNVQVYNSQGDSILSLLTNPHTLDLSSFPNGMYVAVANINGSMVTKKLIKE